MEKITVAIGDVHGCLDQLKALVGHVRTEFPDNEIQWIFVGDYIDRGPDSRGVIQFVNELPNTIALKGNHEDMLTTAWRSSDGYRQAQWDHEYGKITCKSFDVEQCGDIPMSYIRWMEERPYYHQDSMGRVFVHAGIQRNLPLSMTAQSKQYMIWARHEFMLDPDPSVFVIHGHTPVFGGPDLHHNRVNIDTGCVYGGLLTAAVFGSNSIKPSHFIFHTGAVQRT